MLSRLFLVLALSLAIAAPAAAQGLYGCLVNKTQRYWIIEATGWDDWTHTLRVGPTDSQCEELPEGKYEVQSSDGLLKTSFTVTEDPSKEYLGRKLHWKLVLGD